MYRSVFVLIFLLFQSSIGYGEGFIIFTRPDASEYWQIWALDVDTNKIEQITNDTDDKRLLSAVRGKSGFIFRDNANIPYLYEHKDGQWTNQRILGQEDGILQCVCFDDNYVYAKVRPGLPDDTDLWVRIKGKPARIMDNHVGLHYAVDVSPDGKKVLFVRGAGYKQREIYLVDLETEQHQGRLTNNEDNDIYPRFDPRDLNRVIFASDRTGNYELWEIKINEKNESQITQSPGLDNMPAWSPDGEKFAFLSTRSGEPAIWVMDRDGASVKLSGTKGAGSLVWIE